MLNSGEVSVNEADTFHMTCLHYAAQNGHEELANELILRQADLNAENKVIRTQARSRPCCRRRCRCHRRRGRPFLPSPFRTHLAISPRLAARHALLSSCSASLYLLLPPVWQNCNLSRRRNAAHDDSKTAQGCRGRGASHSHPPFPLPPPWIHNTHALSVRTYCRETPNRLSSSRKRFARSQRRAMKPI